MRIAGLPIVLCLLCLGAGAMGCKNKSEADSAPDPAAIKAQQELVARRDALLAARTKLQADRDKLDVEIKDIQAKGGDPAEQIKKRADLDSQIESSTSDLINMVNNKLDAMKQSGDKTANVAAREADLGGREKILADREAKFAERERQFAAREAESAARWKDTCAMAAPVMIQAPTKGGNYGKKDVSDLIQKAKSTMAKKGILVADLPGPSQTLESEAAKAMADNDYNKAYFAAAQLAGQVDAIQINRVFIQAKMARIQAQLKANKVDEGTNAQAGQILSDVMLKYNEGDFGAANRRLNQLGALK
jgi:hypothetical protein